MIESAQACCPCHRDSFLWNYQVLLLFELRPSSPHRALQGFCLACPVSDWIHHWQSLPRFVPSLFTPAVKTQKQLVWPEQCDSASALLACQAGYLRSGALPETTLCSFSGTWLLVFTALWDIHYDPPLPDKQRKLRDSLSRGPKSLNIRTKIQIQTCLLNISPLCQSTLFFNNKEKKKSRFLTTEDQQSQEGDFRMWTQLVSFLISANTKGKLVNHN